MSRILLLCADRLAPRRAGPAIRAIEMARVLAGAGHQVTLATTQPPEVTLPSVALVHVSAATLARTVDETEAVIAPAFLLHAFPSLSDIRPPLLVDLYDPLPFESLHLFPDRSIARRRYNQERTVALTLLAVDAADQILVANRRQADWVLGLMTAMGQVRPGDPDPTTRILVAPYGIPGEPPSKLPGLDPRPPLGSVSAGDGHAPVIVWPGGLWDWTDPTTAVDAVARLGTDALQGPRLLLWGAHPPNPDTPAMAAATRARERARELGLLDRRVFFWDWVPYDERGHWLVQASAAISLHLSGLEARFAHRARVLDGLWASLPVVVTAGDPLSMLVRRHGLGVVVPAGRADRVARALGRVLDPAFQGAARAAVRPLQERLSWDSCLRTLCLKLQAPQDLRARRRDRASTVSVWLRFLSLRAPRYSIALRLAARLLARGASRTAPQPFRGPSETAGDVTIPREW